MLMILDGSTDMFEKCCQRDYGPIQFQWATSTIKVMGQSNAIGGTSQDNSGAHSILLTVVFEGISGPIHSC
jgi:hypothetical protein